MTTEPFADYFPNVFNELVFAKAPAAQSIKHLSNELSDFGEIVIQWSQLLQIINRTWRLNILLRQNMTATFPLPAWIQNGYVIAVLKQDVVLEFGDKIRTNSNPGIFAAADITKICGNAILQLARHNAHFKLH